MVVLFVFTVLAVVVDATKLVEPLTVKRPPLKTSQSAPSVDVLMAVPLGPLLVIADADASSG